MYMNDHQNGIYMYIYFQYIFQSVSDQFQTSLYIWCSTCLTDHVATAARKSLCTHLPSNSSTHMSKNSERNLCRNSLPCFKSVRHQSTIRS